MKEQIKEALKKESLVLGVVYAPSSKKDDWLRWQNERIEQLEKALEMNIELATLELDYEGSLRILSQIAAFSQTALGREE